MAEEPALTPGEADWPRNYFNYFTEIEEHFRIARGTGLFLLSPLDWALIESWKNSGVPLEAVLRGVDRAFEKWRSGRKRTQAVNSLAYCAQAVMAEAAILAGAAPQKPAQVAAPFSGEELRDYLRSNAVHLQAQQNPALREIGDTIARLAEETHDDLEELERLLTSLEEKMIAVVRAAQSEDDLVAARRAFDSELRPYRSKMSAEQIAMLERQFLDRRLIENSGLRRLSLFYLGT
jgi:uncharacterized protein YfaS (alpha-2-macroglobulin family)